MTCRREEHARRARIRLEDALRTASFGDDGRLIVVRRLDLGEIPLHASATTWSRRVEWRFRHLRIKAVAFDHHRAASADVVFFTNAAEPWFCIAARAVRGEVAHEWFWQKAAPGWRSHLNVAETLRVCFRALASQSPLLGLALIRRLASKGGVELLFNALKPADVRLVFADLPIEARNETAGDSSRLDAARVNAMKAVLPNLMLRPLLKIGRTDPRSLLIVAAAFAELGLPIPGAKEASVIAGEIRSALFIRPGVEEESPRPLEVPDHETAHQVSISELDAEPSSEARADRRVKIRTGERLVTSAGGLFFLVRLFQLDGLPSFLNEHRELMEAGLAWKLFHGALRILQINDAEALLSLPNSNLPLPRGSVWRPLLRAHHRSRQLTGLSLRELITRPALVTLTETHIDLFFRPCDADVRIRRAALDVDPGWIGWLQRVVTFHFDRED